MRTIALLLFALFIASSSKAQIQPVQEDPFIEVTGTAEIEVIPDEIYISIILREKYDNKVKVTIETQEESLKKGLKEIGIDLASLSISDANADYVRIKYKTKDILTKKDYSLKVTNATTVGKVFKMLDEIEIYDADIYKVNHSKMDSLRREVKIKAIKAAKDKADYLLGAIGEKTGKPIVVTENQNYDNNYETNIRGSRSASNSVYIDGIKSSDKNVEETIEFKRIKIRSSIYTKFLIK